MTHDPKSSKPRAASSRRTGLNSDPVRAALKYYNIPLTRENYLDLAYLGEKRELSAEEEANLPPEIRLRLG
jgi:hypothetical protein